MLEKLGYDGEGIFSATLSDDRAKLLLKEACDEYFSTKTI